MKFSVIIGSLAILLLVISGAQVPGQLLPQGAGNLTNGLVDQATHEVDRSYFEERRTATSGLGPVYNAASCVECHQSPISGGSSRITVLRTGHRDSQSGKFIEARGGSLVHTQAIDPRFQERLSATENVRSLRLSINLLGDGFVEAIDDSTLISIAREQASLSGGRIAGAVVWAPVLEAPGRKRVSRFGWKDQHASLLSAVADSLRNEIGIINRLYPTESSPQGQSKSDLEDQPDPATGLATIDRLARFIRATQTPPRDDQRARSPAVQAGSEIFDRIGCGICHVRTIRTAPVGTRINGGTFKIPQALGNKIIHPFSDFLLHDVGTGDGIVQIGGQSTANKMRTAPLWGLSTRPWMLHDGKSPTMHLAIIRHRGEASSVIENYERLTPNERHQLLEFLNSL